MLDFIVIQISKIVDEFDLPEAHITVFVTVKAHQEAGSFLLSTNLIVLCLVRQCVSEWGLNIKISSLCCLEVFRQPTRA